MSKMKRIRIRNTDINKAQSMQINFVCKNNHTSGLRDQNKNLFQILTMDIGGSHIYQKLTKDKHLLTSPFKHSLLVFPPNQKPTTTKT